MNFCSEFDIDLLQVLENSTRSHPQSREGGEAGHVFFIFLKLSWPQNAAAIIPKDL